MHGRRAAERAEEGLILDAERKANLAKQAIAQARGEGPMTVAMAAARFFNEVGQHHAPLKPRSGIWTGLSIGSGPVNAFSTLPTRRFAVGG